MNIRIESQKKGLLGVLGLGAQQNEPSSYSPGFALKYSEGEIMLGPP